MSLAQSVRYRTSRRFPRVSGDEPDVGGGVGLDLTFSPRERG